MFLKLNIKNKIDNIKQNIVLCFFLFFNIYSIALEVLMFLDVKFGLEFLLKKIFQ